MINPFKDVDWHPTRQGYRRFARSLMIGWPIVAALIALAQLVRFGELSLGLPAVVAGSGLAVGLWCWLLPSLARPFYVIWYAVASSIGFIVSNGLLASVFLVVVTGTGLALRLLGRNPLERAIDKAAPTYWENAEPAPEPGRYFRQF